MEKQPRHSLNSSSSSFSKIGWRRTRTTKWQSPWIHHTAENGLHFQALGAVYIFDRYGVINNGFLCCFRGLAFFQLAFPLRLCRRSFSCAAVTTLFLWRQHPMLASPPPPRQSSVVLALLVLFAFFARVSFSFFPCFSARKFPLLSYEAPKSQLSDWDCCGVLRTDEMTTVQLTAKLFLYE